MIFIVLFYGNFKIVAQVAQVIQYFVHVIDVNSKGIHLFLKQWE